MIPNYIAAPVNVGQETVYVGALVIKDEKMQRYKLHEVLVTNKNGTPLFQSESADATGDANGPLRSDTPSADSIPDAPQNVNTGSGGSVGAPGLLLLQRSGVGEEHQIKFRRTVDAVEEEVLVAGLPVDDEGGVHVKGRVLCQGIVDMGEPQGIVPVLGPVPVLGHGGEDVVEIEVLVGVLSVGGRSMPAFFPSLLMRTRYRPSIR